MSKRESEEEIVAKYTEGWSLAKIEKEYDLTAFELVAKCILNYIADSERVKQTRLDACLQNAPSEKSTICK